MLAEAKSPKEALRCLQRRLSDAVYRCLLADQHSQPGLIALSRRRGLDPEVAFMVGRELGFESGSRRWEPAGGRRLLVQVDVLGVERAVGLAPALGGFADATPLLAGG